MTEPDYTVTSEEVKRDSDSGISRIKIQCRHDSLFAVIFTVDDGTATIDSFTPIKQNGKSVKGTEKLRLFSGKSHPVKVAHLDNTLTLLATACQYVDEHYDVDVQQALWLDNSNAVGLTAASPQGGN